MNNVYLNSSINKGSNETLDILVQVSKSLSEGKDT